MDAVRGAYIHHNPRFRFDLDADKLGTCIPCDAPRSNLILPLRCFNCDFVVNGAKYRTLGEQRYRLRKHETGISGHRESTDYCCETPECEEEFNNSLDLRAHCRSTHHLLPKRYCTDVGIDAMSVCEGGLHEWTNEPGEQGRTGLLDRLYRQRIGTMSGQGICLPRYCSPQVSPGTPSSSGSRRNRHLAHSYDARSSQRDNRPDYRGWKKRYHRARSPRFQELHQRRH